jgi:hypothetical protein
MPATCGSHHNCCCLSQNFARDPFSNSGGRIQQSLSWSTPPCKPISIWPSICHKQDQVVPVGPAVCKAFGWQQWVADIGSQVLLLLAGGPPVCLLLVYAPPGLAQALYSVVHSATYGQL